MGDISAKCLKVLHRPADDVEVRPPRPHLSLALGASSLVVALTGGLLTVTVGRPAGVASAAAPTTHAVAQGSVLRAATTTPRASTLDAALTTNVRARLAKATGSSYAVVIDVAGKGRVVDVNGGLALPPASTQKLFTTLPYLLKNPARTFVTTISASARPIAGVVAGDLVIKATGDPTLLHANLGGMAMQLTKAGVKRVTGRLVLDIGNLSIGTRRSGWKWSYVPGEVGPLSPFPVRQDTIYSDSTYLSHPTAGNLAMFRRRIHQEGIVINGASAILRSTTSHPVVLASHTSAPISSTIAATLRDSLNFHAEQLLSIEGQSAVTATSAAAGVTGTTKNTDGSGLSSLDRQTARGELALLAYARNSSVGTLFQRSLAVACESGTLKKMMCNTTAAHKVWAKTGTLAHSKQLAGFTVDGKGRRVTFSIICNGVSSISAATKAINSVMVLLRGYTR